MIINERQILHLISIAEHALAMGLFRKDNEESARKFLNEIKNQQSQQLKEIK